MSIGPETVDKMVALVRRMAASVNAEGSAVLTCGADYREALRITEELPEPVDPDLIEARKIAAGDFPGQVAEAYLDGRMDDQGSVGWTLLGIKRGRELERTK